jgi:hypothetical protein
MRGLGTEDGPVFPGMHEASAMVVGATLGAQRIAYVDVEPITVTACRRFSAWSNTMEAGD